MSQPVAPPALVFGDRRVSYPEFDARVAVLARELIGRGVGPEVAVAVVIPRSVELLVALHAVVAAGGQFVPIAGDAPADRTAKMLATAQVALALVPDGPVPPALAGIEGLEVQAVRTDEPADLTAAPVTDADRRRPLRPTDAAYTLFTSGSTGEPKGVTVEHAAIVNRLAWMRDWRSLDGSDVFVQKTPITFDVSVPELFLPAILRATLVIAEPGRHGDPGYLHELIRREQITVVHFVPSMAAAFLDVLGERIGELTSVRMLFASGEALPPPVAQELLRRFAGAQLFNLYGPTEAAVEDIVAQVRPGDATVPIGAPVPGTSAYILDDYLQWVPPGTPGELYLGGVQIARGYARQPALTAERFIADPFGEPGARLYRTGDLVRWTGAGQIEYLGRTDFQVKLRGQRIELGEIESAIAGAPGVVHAAATVTEAPGGGDFLVAYVAPATVDLDAVKAHTAAALPEYMRPSLWTLLTDVTLGSAGKLDRKALPEPDFDALAGEYVAPQTDAERAVAEVFAEVLGVDRIGVTDVFFDIGGTSLSAMRAVARAGEALGVELSVRDLFAAPTVRDLVRAAGSADTALAPIVRAEPRPARIPLTFAQQRMWFINQLDPAAPTYNIAAVLRGRGRLDEAALHAALVDVVTRHEVLRTTFPADDGVPYQRIIPADEAAAGLDWAVVTTETELLSAATTGFDVAHHTPLRVRLWRVDSDEFVLAVVAHHIGADGESMRPLIGDLVVAYEARHAGAAPAFAPLPVQVADFALWQHQTLGSPDDPDSVIGRQLQYWRTRLDGAPDVLDLPADRVRPTVASHRGATLGFDIPGPLAQRIAAFARSRSATPFMVAHAAVAVLLSRLGGTDDVSVATPVAGRGQAVLDPLVGMFVNTVVLRTRTDSGESFDEVLDRVKRGDLDAFAHADAPFEAVVEAVDPVRSEAFGPLAQVVLAVTEAAGDRLSVDLGDLVLGEVELDEVPAPYDLGVYVDVADDGSAPWRGTLVYATDLFDADRVAAFARRLVTLLDAVTADPAAPVGDVDLLADEEKAWLAGLPAPVRPAAATGTLVDVFAASAAAHPDSVAVRAGGTALTYAEVDARSEAIAAGLEAAGVRRGDLVGLATARSADLVSSILGILKSGAGYLPLDLTNPVDRLGFILGDAAVPVVLVDASTAHHPLWADSAVAARTLDVDDLVAEHAGAVRQPVAVPEQSRAYVIYTSGSTGEPKGVEVTHGDVVALMAACADDFDLRSDDVWTLFHSYAFDFAVWEMWGALASGASVVIVDREIARDADAFVGLLADEQVTVLSLTPSAFYQFIDARRDHPDRALALRYLVFGGEELRFEQVRRWFDEFPARGDDDPQLVNMYGITETTVHVSFRPIDRTSVSAADPSFIGRPLSSLAIHLLDDRLRPVPDGVVGEMYVAGEQLAQGYLRRPGLTSTRFVANPFAGGGAASRLYRTGDLARRRGDDVEYLGRADGQVQLRGFRIEYGEVEAALLAAPGVRGAAASVVVDPHRGDLLVGYVTVDPGAPVDPAQVREAAAAAVPRYMVPDLVMVVDRLPLTGNGKLDRKALPKADFNTAPTEYEAPATPAEEAVAAVFAEVLGVDQVSVTESFFDVGGNSLSAMRIVARAGAALDVDFSARDLFDAPTVRDLVKLSADRVPALGAIEAVSPRPQRIPLSFAQQRMWFINRLDADSPAYNIPAVLRLTGPLDVEALRGALVDVVTRHEVLRTTFPDVDGTAYQRIDAAAEVGDRLDWAVVDTEDQVIAAATTGFDLAAGWPIRARLWRDPAAADEHLLAVVLHHIAADGESIAPLVGDLVTAYTARTGGASAPLRPLPVQFADYAIWQHRVLGSPSDETSVVRRQLAYWSEQLAGLPELLELPTDHPRPAASSGRGARIDFTVPAPVAASVARLARSRGATPFMVVHTALAALLARMSGTADIAIGTPVAGRGQEVLEPLVGMFVNTLVLRTPVRARATLGELLDDVREVDTAAFAHADVPFEMLVDELDPVRSTAFEPFTQVWLSFVADPGGAVGSLPLGAGVSATPVDTGDVPAKVDLLVGVTQAGTEDTGTAGTGTGGWSGWIDYAVDLFEPATVERLADGLIRLLAALADEPDTPVARVGVLTADESARLVPATGGPAVEPVVLREVFADAARRWPDRTAVVDGTGTALTYAELDRRSNRLARWLAARGAVPETAVALALPRSAELLVAIWAVAKTGAAYVPIDPDYPADRVAGMVADCGAMLGLTTGAARPGLPAGVVDWSVPAELGDELAALDEAPLTTAESVPVAADNLAYLIFTSGSTGRPKGVAVTHTGLANFAAQESARLDAGDAPVVLGFASPSFDASVLEYLLAVRNGGTLAYRPVDAVGGTRLAGFMAAHRVTHTFLTPTVLSTLDPEAVPDLAGLAVGGEAVPGSVVQRWAPHTAVHNLYGPTETTIGITISAPMAPGQPVRLGPPIGGVGLVVLDANLAPAPVGALGELYVLGSALSRGYTGDPGLTASRFVAAPSGLGAPGARMYRTGDLVRWVRVGDDYVVEYAGRGDGQVKMRGLRIETGEIESVLADYPGVESAAVFGTGAEGLGSQPVTALAGFVVADPGLDTAALKAFAGTRLPAFMVPATLTVIDHLPRTPVGKLDVAALPVPVPTAGEYVEPRGRAETVIAAAVAEILGLDRVGADDAFFDVGGNSLSAMRLVNRIADDLGVEVSIRDVFEAPTVRQLAAALGGRGQAVRPVAAVSPRPVRIPLSFAQRRMWFINTLDPASPAYNIPLVLRLTGDLDVPALRAAVADVVRRHEVLRTTVEAENGTPYQRIADAGAVEGNLDWAVVASRDEFDAAAMAGFDVAAQWPIRARVLAVGPREHLVAIVVHHIAADGESMAPLLTDLLTAYDARAAGTEPGTAAPAVQFADFAIWQHDALGAGFDPATGAPVPGTPETVIGRQLEYWTKALAGLPDVLDLPGDRPRPPVASGRGRRFDFEIDPAIGRRVADVAAQLGATPFIVAHAALAVVLARLSATDDIAVATPVAGRGQRDLEPLVGMFVNTLVLRARVSPSMSFGDLVRQIRDTDLDAFAHADVPFEAVVDAVDPVRSEAFAPLAQVMLSFDPAAGTAALETGGLGIEPVDVDSTPAQQDLLLAVSTSDDRAWSGSLVYATDLFDESTASRFAQRFVRALGELTGDLTAAVGDAALASPAEQSAILADSAGAAVAVADATIADAVAAQIAATPDAVALAYEGRDMTYREFGDRIGELADRLVDAGVGPERAVGLCLPRGPELMIAVHAVLAAGGQYVPIDTAAPADRAATMVATAGVAVLLVPVGDPPAPLAGLDPAVRRITVDASAAPDVSAASESAEAPEVSAGAVRRRARQHPDNAAYTLFTSGSTGEPKGVTVSHRSVLNRLRWGLDAFAWSAGDRVILKTPYTFDVSVPELMGPVMSGATVVIARPDGHRDPEYIADLIESSRATSVHFVPSMLSVFLEVIDDRQLARLTSVKWLFASGEALTSAQVRAARTALPQTSVHNLFGPTEAAVEVSWSDVSRVPDPVTIGRPVWNTTLMVLDARLRPVPVGVPGELYLGGVQVARGYADRPGLTAERFVADPFGEPGSRLYRTGDLVRRTVDGEVEYLGRTDFQVKLRGQRVELGEIEAAMSAAPGVVHVAATVATAPGGGEFLVGYVAPADVDLDEVAAVVAARVPEYMRPSVWVPLDDVVLGSAGKLDRKALPEPDFTSLGGEYAAPETSTEQALAAAIAGLLGVDRVSVTDSFFALGGDSIMSIQLASAARGAGVVLTPRDIFEHRTVRAMARAVDAGLDRAPMLAEPPGGPAGLTPLPPVVRWMIDAAADGSFDDFNQSIVLIAPDALTPDHLDEMVSALIRVHPMLSARLDDSAGGWRLTTGADAVPDRAGETVVEAAVGTPAFEQALVDAHAQAARRLAPARGALVQTALVRGLDGARLVVVAHHLAVDAVSWPMLVGDLAAQWARVSSGQPVPITAEHTSARSWFTALDERRDEVAAELDYWLARSPQRGTVLAVGDDGGTVRWRSTAALETSLPGDLVGPLLTSVPAAFGQANTADVLLGALARAVRSWQAARGIDDEAPITVLSEGHGRYEDVLETGADPRRADLSRTVGWFTSIAPLRLDPGRDVVHAVKTAKEERLGRTADGLGYGLLRYADDSPLAERPLPAITFNYLGARTAAAADADTVVAMMPDPHAPALPGSIAGELDMMSPLTINAVAGAGADGPMLTADIRYPVSMLGVEEVRDLVARWTAELRQLVEAVAAADPGLSPSDVPGALVTQADLDAIAAGHPGADVWGLSPLQRGLYFHSVVAASTGAPDVYVVSALLRLAGELDLDRLHAAAAGLLDAHPVLRSAFVTTGSGAQVGVVAPRVGVPWRVVDLGAGAHDEAVHALVDRELADPFDLADAPLLRFVVMRRGEATDVLFVAHHLVLDGWSTPLVFADLLALYTTGSTFTPSGAGRAGFKDYLRSIARRDTRRGLDVWRRVLDPASGPTLIAPGARVEADALPASLRVPVPAALAAAVDRAARTAGVTVSTLLQAAWALFLSQRTGNRVVTFGETVSGRPADIDGIDTVVGLFINTLPVVVDVDPDMTLEQIVGRLHDDKVALLDYHFIGLPEIAAVADGVAFDTLVVHESYPVDADGLTAAGTGEHGPRIVDAQFGDATHYPLNMITAGDGDALTVTLKYLPEAFSAAQVGEFGAMVVRLLETLAEAPSTRAGEVSLLDDAGREAALARSRGPVTPVPTGSVADAVAATVAHHPTATALIVGDRQLSYAEFGARVAVLARELIARGIGPDTAVAVCMDRGAEMLVAIHAVVAAGGQYVPIDVETPAARARSMAATAGVRTVLVAPVALPEPVVGLTGADVLTVDASVAVDPATPPIADDERIAPLHPATALYTLFTSGSTGEPKGVTVGHRAVRNRLAWMAEDNGLDAGARFLLKTPYTFDVSVWELFLPFVLGAPLVVARPDGHRDPGYLAGLIAGQSVSVVHFVPSMLSVFADVTGDRLAGLTSLRQIITSGEALPPAVAQQVLAALPQASLINLYGPTEAAVDVTQARVDRGADSVTIGVPVANTTTYVLDARLRPVPVGVAGELYLGGVQVARGYATRPGLTAERFVADPFGGAGDRLYRTGDLVRWNDDGEIEYLGRTDFQVKLRGQRVELGEIEAAIAAAPGVVHAAATVARAPGGGEFLVGYVAPADVDLDAVAAAVAARVPEYMRPGLWVPLERVTLGTSGKLDRKALPAPDFGALAGEYVAPDGALEETIAAVFADVLGVDRASATESFFELGGNSLSAMRLIARLAERDVAVELPRLFEHPSPRDLAQAVRDDLRASGVVVRLRSTGVEPPLFCIHPADGLAWAYGELVGYLPGRPVYGLQNPAVVAGETPMGSIGEFAQRYVAEIKAIAPEGPYHLLGWSLGGVIAFEVARLLRHGGDEVAFLGLMDPAAGSAYTAQVSRAEHDAVVADLRASIDAMAGGLGAADVDPAASTEETIGAQLAAVGAAPGEQVRRMVDALDAGADLLESYEPGRYGGSVLFIRAMRGKGDPSSLVEYWAARVDGQMSVVDADVEHGAMGTAEGFALFGVQIERALNGTLRKYLT
nr:non-ribosomal peptide synthetase [Gordonia crocea]